MVEQTVTAFEKEHAIADDSQEMKTNAMLSSDKIAQSLRTHSTRSNTSLEANPTLDRSARQMCTACTLDPERESQGSLAASKTEAMLVVAVPFFEVTSKRMAVVRFGLLAA